MFTAKPQYYYKPNGHLQLSHIALEDKNNLTGHPHQTRSLCDHDKMRQNKIPVKPTKYQTSPLS